MDQCYRSGMIVVCINQATVCDMYLILKARTLSLFMIPNGVACRLPSSDSLHPAKATEDTKLVSEVT